MTPDQAHQLILTEATEGIAYTSRFGDYSTPEHFNELIQAIEVYTDTIPSLTIGNR